MNRMSKLTFTFTCLASFTMPLFAEDHSASSVSPDAALAKLKEGNARFATSTMSQAKPTAERRAATAQASIRSPLLWSAPILALRPRLSSIQTSGIFLWPGMPAIWSTITPWAALNTRSNTSEHASLWCSATHIAERLRQRSRETKAWPCAISCH